MLFEATKMMPNILAKLQVITVLLAMFREKYDRAWISPKILQKQPKLKVIIHAFVLSVAQDPNRTGCLLGTRNVIG